MSKSETGGTMTLEQAKKNVVAAYGPWEEAHTAFDNAHTRLQKLARKCLKADTVMEQAQAVYTKLKAK
jgi:hypothetical protein